MDKKKTAFDPLIYKGMKLVEQGNKNGEVTLTLEIIEDMINVNGSIHGGMIFTLADYCSGMGCYNLGYRVATMESSVNFIRAINKGTLKAVNKVLHHGRRTIVNNVNIYDEDDRLILTGNFTMAVLAGSNEELKTIK